jgi:hypothetical protein
VETIPIDLFLSRHFSRCLSLARGRSLRLAFDRKGPTESSRCSTQQGLLKIGDRFYLSAVEVKGQGQGVGVGHFYEFDAQGTRLKETVLGEGAMYHHRWHRLRRTMVWVPWPNTNPAAIAIIYKVNPRPFRPSGLPRERPHRRGGL